ncbi:MAG: HAMP domain-containing sensor histidine kinase [Gracilimonas sp.]
MLNKFTLRKRIFLFSSILITLAFTLMWLFVRPQYKEAIINERTTIVSQLQEYSLQRSDQVIRNWLNSTTYTVDEIENNAAQTQDIVSRTLNLTPGLMRITISEEGSSETVDIRRSMHDDIDFSFIEYNWLPSNLDPTIRVSLSSNPQDENYFLIAQKAIRIGGSVFFLDMYFDASSIVDELINIPLGGTYEANIFSENGTNILPHKEIELPETILNEANFSNQSTIEINGAEWFLLNSRFQSIPLWHVVAVEDSFILKPVYDLIIFSLIAGGSIFLILFTFSWYVSRRVNKPVEQIISDVEYMSTLNFEHPIKPVTLPEFSLMQNTLETIRLTLQRYQKINVEKVILEEWKNRYMMTYSKDLIGILNSSKHFSFINNNFEQLLGDLNIKPDSAHLDDILSHPKITVAKFEQRIHNPDPYTVKINSSEISHYLNDNKNDYYDFQYVSIINKEGHEEAALIILHDMTEDRLNDIKRNEMINIIAHELKNPITSIMGLSEVLMDSTYQMNESEKDNMINEILISGQRMKSLVNRFLDIQRIESGRINIEFEPIDLMVVTEEVRAITHPLLKDKNLKTKLVREGRNFQINGSRDLIFDAIQNLLSNAIKYGGKDRTIEIKLSHKPDHHSISITDHGYGISIEEQKKIFDKFYRVKSNKKAIRETGTGLGLSYVREIIDLHNGEIELESNEDIGSRFTLVFPK